MPSATGERLRELYEALSEAYSPRDWWPGDSPTEIIIGAILTQNTNWRNVEKAIGQLRAAGLLDWGALREVPVETLAEHIRPAGYFNVKARRLKNFVCWLWEEYDGDLGRLASIDLAELRGRLLSINGIGPETADSIILYALDRPSFVVDTYTARVAARHGLIDGPVGYDELKALFEDNLTADVKLYNEYHALLVAVGKHHCRPKAQCSGCPLERFEHDAASC